ncbi:hypothetical protein [Xanthovirga aplysinae]|uniref:hypothetical protein n=1 Tax=Xanthovirga aplysinae TaxID=2529853 RepID=UPI0012BD135B|nr:hypothetical protein [Xanthovirga aplysinae]MTI33436.1 hypothetical protein [Xanthovirga aplysinae]
MMKAKILIGLFFAFGVINFAQAQAGWNWPEDKATAEEKYVLSNDYTKQQNWAEAVGPWRWLYKEAPNLNKALYLNGVKIYKGLADAEKDAKTKIAYADTVMMLYDQRVELYDEEANVRNRQAFDAYKYFKSDKAKYGELLSLFQKTFELNGNKVIDNNLIAYMDVVRIYKATNPDAMSDEQALEVYEQISDILDSKKAAKTNLARLEKYGDQIDKILAMTVKVDCEFIENNMAPKLVEDPSNLKLAKQIFKMSLAGKCSDNSSYLLAAKVIQDNEPTFAMAKLIAGKAANVKNYDEAFKFYDKAIELATDEMDKSDIYMNKAKIYAVRGNRSSARSNAFKAVSIDASKKEAYALVGNLYMQSYESLKEGKNPVEDRGVFLAAYEMFRKAGNSKGMQLAKEQFPSNEDIFNYGMKVGEKMHVGGWINSDVVIQKR